MLDIVQKFNIKNELDFGIYPYYQMLKDKVLGKNDSWAILFYVSMYLKKDCFLFPNISLIKNIGFDGSGVHCGKNDNLKNKEDSLFNKEACLVVLKKKIEIQTKIVETIKKGLKSENIKNIDKLKKKLKKILEVNWIHFFLNNNNNKG